MKAHEFLRLNAGFALTPDRFCISFDEGDPEDPFSIVLSYDGRFPQPWSRTEVTRRIAAIIGENASDPIYTLISDEGDVYMLTPHEIEQDRIEGAGLYSADAVGYGQISGIAEGGDKVWAFGFGGQIYCRDDGDWQKLDSVGEDAARQSIVAAAMGGDGSMWFCGTVTPPLIVENYQHDPILQEKLNAARAAGDFDRYTELMDNLGQQMSGGAVPVLKPLFLRYADGRLSRFDIDGSAVKSLMAIHVESPSRVWLTGSEGAILFGSAETGFSPVPHAGQVTENLVSIDRFRDRFIIASDFGLFEFDGHVLTRLKLRLNLPEINRNTPNPLRIQGVGDILIYFDLKHGVCRWDGETWDWVDIPDALLEREFKGLK